MSYTTLISIDEASKHLHHRQWQFVDCRYYLENIGLGRQEYDKAHIPGALYGDLGADLSSPVVPGVTSRHPLPDAKTLSQTFSNWGIAPKTQVVVYDQGPGMIAARLWWMLRWLGHDTVAVMEGGWKKWLDESRPVSGESPVITPQSFKAKIRPALIADADEVLASVNNATVKILDARAADRYRGENETLDPIAGHIPGALSAPFANNVGDDGNFRPVGELKTMYEKLLGGLSVSKAIVYCGSGVTAAHNILAMEHAGLGMARLYPGSWSHWITDKHRPIATGV